MNQEVCSILETLGFDAEAFGELKKAEECAGTSDEWNALIQIPLVQVPENDWKALQEQISEIALRCGLAPQVLHLLYLSLQLPAMEAAYRDRGIPEEFFWDTAGDLRCKLAECRERFGVSGTASFLWQIPFFFLRMFTLGRLTYEKRVFPGPEHTCGGVTVREGDVVLGLHIPSGAPFDRESRMDSYRKAFDFYGHTKDKPLIVHGSSWLLSPDHEKELPATSNIVDFIHDFDMLGSVDKTGFPDAWRIYGSAASEPMENWPRKTALQKLYYKLMSTGQKAKGGFGILVFDGEKLLTGRGRTEE